MSTLPLPTSEQPKVNEVHAGTNVPQPVNVWEFVVSTPYDDSADAMIGTFSDNGDLPSAILRTGINPNREYRYFIPSTTIEQHYASLRKTVNPRDSRKRCYGHKTALHLARSYVEHDHARLEALASGQWDYIGVLVELRLNERTIGSDSLWGIESDSDSSYLAEIISECQQNAYHEAMQFCANLTTAKLPAFESIETREMR